MPGPRFLADRQGEAPTSEPDRQRKPDFQTSHLLSMGRIVATRPANLSVKVVFCEGTSRVAVLVFAFMRQFKRALSLTVHCGANERPPRWGRRYCVFRSCVVFKPAFAVLAACLSLFSAQTALAGDHLWSGDWALTLGGTGFVGPKFEGSKKNSLQFAPIISLGKQGIGPRYVSRNDNPSLSLFDEGAFRAGVTGKLVMPRDPDDEKELKGMKEIKLGGELGAFAEVYPTEYLRVRGEMRQGIRSHHGVVGDIAADGFVDVTPNIRVSAGPRMRIASADYFDHYYGVSAASAAAGGPSAYSPSGGIHSVGVGGAVDWKPTENITASSFVEYRRLTGPAADSSLVKERGSENQLVIGLSASYKFNFTLE